MKYNALEQKIIEYNEVSKDANDKKEHIVHKCFIKRSWTRLYPEYTHPDTQGTANKAY
jgi:hypothetical protein